MIEVLSRRGSLCETWRYRGAMIVVCETKEAQQRRVVDSRHGRLRICSLVQQEQQPYPVGWKYSSLVQMASQTQLTVTGFGEIQYANKVLPCGAMSRS